MKDNLLYAGRSIYDGIYEHGIYQYGFKCGKKSTEIEFHKNMENCVT